MANPSIPIGTPTKLNGAAPLTAPADLVFAFQPGGRSDMSAVFQTLGTITTLTASLQISLDGGTTWQDSIVAASFLSTAANSLKTVTPVIAGALYRIHATALTGSQDIWVCSN